MMVRRAWGFAVVAGVLLVGFGTSHAQLTPCTGDSCIKVTVGSPEGTFSIGQAATFPISFEQGTGEGVDTIAAVAMTVGIPGLQMSQDYCDSADADGIGTGISIPEAISSTFRVVIENAKCTDTERDPPLNRTRCLCPGDGQTRDSFINIVVFGPKTLPTPGSGPVEIPVLPNGELLSITANVASTSQNPIPLHVYAETDATAPPQFSAYLSVGNTNAVDETADRDTSVSKVLTTDGAIQVIGGVQCTGDCNGNCIVEIGEITTGVNDLLLDVDPQTNCVFGYTGPLVTIGDVTTAVNYLLNDCPSTCVPQ